MWLFFGYGSDCFDSFFTELSHGLNKHQFRRFGLNQIANLENEQFLPIAKTVANNVEANLDDEALASVEYKFIINYSIEAGSKGKSHIKFVGADEVDDSQTTKVVLKKVPLEGDYPFKSSQVVAEVKKRASSKFTSASHINAWKNLKIRPPTTSKNLAKTNRQYCLHHQLNGGYTYNQAWIDHLVDLHSDAKNAWVFKRPKPDQEPKS